MCGIIGLFNLNGEPISVSLLRSMTDAIAHRGPDGEGYYTDSFIGFGHRRLAIIDLSPAGHQPMVTPDDRFVITYNGEVYNFQELRIELESKGHRFHSKTDAEVVLKAYAEWGEKALDRFNGMFAFAIWDKHKQELFIARDRYGIKPLYYTLQGKKFMFASEVKAFYQHPEFKADVDTEALLEYFTFQNFFTDKTLFSKVSVLPSGHYMKIPLAATETPKPVQYWDFHFEEDQNPASDQEYLEELNRLFVQAVNRQLISDVEIGSYLSGGMDSGSITALASNQLPYIKTFTCGFDLSSASGMELSFDERKKAEFMSATFKTEHYEMVLKSGDMERAMKRLVWHLEEPRVGLSYPNYYAAQLASKFVKVCMSGAGGDELFGGYPWRYYRAAACTNFDDYVDKYYAYWQRLLDNTLLKQVFSPIWSEVDQVWTRDIFSDVFLTKKNTLQKPEDYINHSLYLESKTFLHGLLMVDDKLSMASSLETRVPFLDNDLVDFAMKLPVKMKLGNLGEVVRINENDTGDKQSKYFQRTNDGKLLLRKAMDRYIPEEITTAVKQGFSAPDGSWFKGESIDWVRETVTNKNASIYDYFDYEAVNSIVGEHLTGQQNRRLLVWSLLYFETFLNEFKMNRAPVRSDAVIAKNA